MCRRQRLFIKSDYCIHGLIKEKKTKTTQIQNKTKQKNVQSKDLKFQTTQYNLSKIV